VAGLGKRDFLARRSSVGVRAINVHGEESAVEAAAAEDVAGSVNADGDVAADLRLQRALLAAGLMGDVRPLGTRAPILEPPPLQLDGTPLSETIVAERR
jgi:hypothetical protein